MSVYWLLFAVPSFFALIGKRRNENQRNYFSINLDPLWIIVGITLVFFIGFRYEIGGDWDSYLFNFNTVKDYSLQQILQHRDPGYYFLNWISHKLNWGIIGVNFLCAMFFVASTVFFCRHLPRPFLAMSSAIPYLITVVSIGYTRQGVALGFTMMALVMLQRKSYLFFYLFGALATTFHMTSLIVFPIAMLAYSRNRIISFILLSATGLLISFFFLSEFANSLIENYLNEGMQSSGALLRLFMIGIPSLLFILTKSRLNISEQHKILWNMYSIISLLLLAVYFFSPSSTAVDRIALYFLPIILVTFSYMPDLFILKRKKLDTLIIILIITFNFLIYFVWLNFAVHSKYWVPYKNFFSNFYL